jgi:L-ascorbate metabolism protein UlaG (beta-lactamase superfamily)
MAILTITRIVHASVLLDFTGSKILTDPWFSQLHGHYWGEPLGIALTDLPYLSGVVVSHKDYDHYDMATFRSYPEKDVPFVVRRGIAEPARQAGFSSITELEPWETTMIGDVQVTAAPAKHKEEMGVLQNTYLLQAHGFTVYFGADSLLIPDVQEVARRFPQIDVALLPINGLTIRVLGNRKVVMNAEDAAEACAVLRPRVAIPIHYRYTSNWWRKLLIHHSRTSDIFVEAAQQKACNTTVQVIPTGKPFVLAAQ